MVPEQISPLGDAWIRNVCRVGGCGVAMHSGIPIACKSKIMGIIELASIGSEECLLATTNIMCVGGGIASPLVFLLIGRGERR